MKSRNMILSNQLSALQNRQQTEGGMTDIAGNTMDLALFFSLRRLVVSDQ